MKPAWRQCALGFTGLGAFALGLSQSASTGHSTEKVDFNRDVRPIISKCMSCHGPSAEAGAAGLRLDSFKGATIELKSGHRAIVPGKPEQSELIRRINATNDDVMPPPETHKTLSADDKRVLHDWIAQGAEYKEHWAFVKPVRPPIPKVKDSRWPLMPIDRFVLAKLESNGLKPEPDADRSTWLRRVTLDITGLPPTYEEVQAFESDRSGSAYERVVNRLLDSPRYGERMAMDWMDYARYADSNGYQADFERFQSRWRDWVIDAFNKNMPYDQFTVEQLAGDLLPNATTDQKLATAFSRNHRINTEGGVIAEEWRVENVIDRVETTSAIWLGLTAGCARCHDHKYDPLTQKDFYRLFAYFNNVPESGTGEERPVNHPPTMKAPTDAQAERMNQMTAQLSSLQQRMDAKIQSNLARAQSWKLKATLPQVQGGNVVRVALGSPTSPNVKVEGKPTFSFGRATGAVATNDTSYLDLGNLGDFDGSKPFSYGAWINPEKVDGSPFSKMDSMNGFRGWECSLYDGRVQAHLINKWPENAIKIASKSQIRAKEWTHVMMTYDGSKKAAGFKMYINGKPVEVNVENDKLTETIQTAVTVKVGRRTNSETYNGQVDDLIIVDRLLQPEEVAKLASTHPAATLLKIDPKARTPEQRQQISKLWCLENDKAFQGWYADWQKTDQDRRTLDMQIPDVMVMKEMEKPRDCFVLQRGQYDKHGEKVDAGIPAFLPPLPKGAPNNRLGLAEWIVSPENPLTARVTVNRLWERFFGIGIVDTIEDFGTRADFPSNPELLDYLATDLIRLKWNLKDFIKTIVLSRAYRQSSQLTAEKLQADPANKLISRGPRFRLPGEVIRDQALFVSGLLVEKLGGPSVRPYQPEGIWDETNFYGNLRNYKHDTGDGLYRRSLYTIWKRTAAPPNMLLFDVPSREACRVHRARTDTPLQALTLLNDETYIEAARVLAQKVMREGGNSPDKRLRYAFQRVLCRDPSDKELKLLVDGWNKWVTTYRKDPQSAKDLILIGDAAGDLGLDKAELAAYTICASTLLNLDEVVNKE